MNKSVTQEKSVSETNGPKCDYRTSLLTMYARKYDEELKADTQVVSKDSNKGSDSPGAIESVEEDEGETSASEMTRSETEHLGDVVKREQNNQSPVTQRTTAFSVSDILDPRKFTGSQSKRCGNIPDMPSTVHPWLTNKDGELEESDDDRLRDDSGL